jgi:hypothetical protein
MNAIIRIVERINGGESVGALSTGEQIAAAFLFNRMDWLPEAYKHPLDAIDRLGDNWLQMCLSFHKNA